MSTLKIKQKNKLSTIQVRTVDGTHKQISDGFLQGTSNLPELECELGRTRQRLGRLESMNASKYTTSDIKEKPRLRHQINKLQNNIANIRTNSDEMEYYSIAGNFLVLYYDMDHCDDQTVFYEETNDSDIVKEDSIYGEIDTDMTELNKLLKRHKKKNTRTAKQVKKRSKCKQKNNNNILSCLGVSEDRDSVNDKAIILDSYLSCVDKVYFSSKNKRKDPILICDYCECEKLVNHTEGLYICTTCGEVEQLILDNEKMNSKDPLPEKNGYPYKRINHFNEWLSQFQAKESTDIPDEIYYKVRVELKKQRFRNIAMLTIPKMKKTLKKLDLVDYYEHIPYIISKLTKRRPPTISRDTEDKLRQMFKLIESVFVKTCPKTRTNFLSYSFVLHKMCQLLELDEFLKCFPLLKSDDKLRQQDIMWKEICKELRWEFYPSDN